MKTIYIAAITAIFLSVQGCAMFYDAIDKAANEKGAVVTSSGMVYRSTQEGSGKNPTSKNTVEVNYRGTLPDGSEFDSNNNIRFQLNRVIPCWTEGLQMMKVGGKAQLVCPPELAYGRDGAGDKIPPNSILIFDVELLSIY